MNSSIDIGLLKSLPSDLIQDNLKMFAAKNEDATHSTTIFDNYFKDGKVVEFVFGTCDKLGGPLEVKYIAVELFDRFMQKHILDLWQTVHSSDMNWDVVETRIIDQVTLRALTCIQLASKLSNHYSALTARRVKKLLSDCNRLFSINSIIRSEQRVLQTLDFKLMLLSPLDYMEVLLEALGKNCPGLNNNKIGETSKNLLDVFYLRRFQIFEKLRQVSGVKFEKKLENDHMYIAASIIVASGYVIDSSSSDTLIEQVALIICCGEAELIMLSTALIHVALEA